MSDHAALPALEGEGGNWSEAEVLATVESYFEMLQMEAHNQDYRKSEFNEALRARLGGRSKGAVEYKYQNVSAVLYDLELPYVRGYKPARNRQSLLDSVVADFLNTHPEVMESIMEGLAQGTEPGRSPASAVLVDPPEFKTTHNVPDAGPRVPAKSDHAARDAANRELGRAGEEWVVNYEVTRLAEAGRPDLAKQVRWVADEVGDGLGYDVDSFDMDGGVRHIEVKTTNGGRSTPFLLSPNELRVSRELGEAFFLYRVFRFRSATGLFIVTGDVSQHVHLQPTQYRARWSGPSQPGN